MVSDCLSLPPPGQRPQIPGGTGCSGVKLPCSAFSYQLLLFGLSNLTLAASLRFNTEADSQTPRVECPSVRGRTLDHECYTVAESHAIKHSFPSWSALGFRTYGKGIDSGAL